MMKLAMRAFVLMCAFPWMATAADLPSLDAAACKALAQPLTSAAEKADKPVLKIVGNLEKANGARQDKLQMIVVPQKDFDPETPGANADPGLPLAHLFLPEGFVPLVDGKPIDQARLGTLTINTPSGPQKFGYLALAARHTNDGAWRLFAYGADAKPLVDAEFGEGNGNGVQPVSFEVRDWQNNAGNVFITLFDEWQCSFKLGKTGS